MREPRANFSRSELPERTIRLLNRGNRRNPDVLLVEADGGPVVVKDFAARGAVVRATVARWITAREAGAYQWLAGHPSVPRFLGWLDPLAFAVEYRPGRRMSRHLMDDAGPDFIGALNGAVDELHRRGLVHLDLGHRSNVLVDAQGAPVLIDFASALWFRPGGAAARWLLPRLIGFDRRAVGKYLGKLERQRYLREASPASPGPSSGDSPASGGSRGESRPT